MSLTMKDISNYVEREQVHTMLDAASACSQRDYLLLKMLWVTGVRVDELIHIRPLDLEYDNDMVRVLKAKGGKQRRVYVHPDTNTLTELRAYISENGIVQDTPIFPLSRQWVHKLVRRYGAVIDRRNLHPHSLRHSFAINSVRNGVDIRRLQQVLGHASMNTTARYLLFRDSDLKEAYANVPF